MKRYLSVFKTHTLLLIILIALIVVSSLTKGFIATITSIVAGVIMILLGVGAALWILKTPTKKSKEEVV